MNVYTIKQAADLLSISEKTIYKWIKKHPKWFVYSNKAIDYVHFFIKKEVVEELLRIRYQAIDIIYELYDSIKEKEKLSSYQEVDEVIKKEVKNYFGWSDSKKIYKFMKETFMSEEILRNYPDFINYLKQKYEI
ncbi:helix-turn-helix domain-containing protein [Caminibacter pacificus]|uniref:Excisionase family DNA binding protein n=1 Tax=Caminibacter pacificus TaxID=1424653 RepID=A0AAJ4RB45_9BACT|nr:helix-turn-helix domain-containing protein [Caminibacter pacificus]QDD68226.1 helix-turn-helix domain-containing protein [Caminibacter pacificus]ROR38740.1 excisionase family DNA binding protein [Caminibacter pacificus]